jgi:endonuclease/exonuclease/phosphatase family metal-dependent hydrolase
VTVVGGALLTPQPVVASPYISPPTASVVSASSGSFTILAHARNADRYRIFASTKKSDVYYQNIVSGHSNAQRSSLSSSRVTIRGLRYTRAPYYYRVEAVNGRYRRYSAAIYSIGLQPAAPTSLTASSSRSGTYLTWQSNANGFQVEQARDSTFTQDVRRYRLRMPGEQFTPFGLRKGDTYYFRVRAINLATASAYSSSVSAQALTLEQPVSVMTFNLLEASFDGRREGGQRVAPWSQRKTVAARLVRQGDPDVVAIQEGATYVGHHRRQVDSLRAALGGRYRLARTEIPPNRRHHFRTACYILYKPTQYKAVGRGWHWAIGTHHFERYAAYQILQNRRSRARFLFVDPHLLVGGTYRDDVRREHETESLLRQARRFGARHHVPIVYAGDFNSHAAGSDVSFDGPGTAMLAAKVADAFGAAQSLHNERYDTANQYMRRPPTARAYIDHVYAPPGVAVRSWRQIIDLRHGRFVGVMASDHNPLVSTVDFPY